MHLTTLYGSVSGMKELDYLEKAYDDLMAGLIDTIRE
jgi:hypothetical protein